MISSFMVYTIYIPAEAITHTYIVFFHINIDWDQNRRRSIYYCTRFILLNNPGLFVFFPKIRNSLIVTYSRWVLQITILNYTYIIPKISAVWITWSLGCSFLVCWLICFKRLKLNDLLMMFAWLRCYVKEGGAVGVNELSFLNEHVMVDKGCDLYLLALALVAWSHV